MKKNIPQEVKDLIEKSHHISIVAHQNPDGDAAGSTLGLAHYFREKGKTVTVITPDAVPGYLDFLPGFETLINNDEQPEQVNTAIQSADLIFLLDFGQLHRCGSLCEIVGNAGKFTINIDHHPEPATFGFSFHEVAASSTCELVYFFIHTLDPAYIFSYNAGTCLYTGLVTDTGCFKYAVRPQTFHVAKKLLKSGLRPSFITGKIFDVNTPEKLKLTGYALNEKMVILPELKTAFISLTQEEMDRFHVIKGDTEGLVNQALSLKGIVFAAFFNEREPGKTKISFRSKGNFEANTFSKNHFEGGGHKNAAGGFYPAPVQSAINKFLEVLPNYKSALWAAE